MTQAAGAIMQAPFYRNGYRDPAPAKPDISSVEAFTGFGQYEDLLVAPGLKMAVNLKTAKALGLAIPPSIMLRADEVIQ